ncbi:hypothetical protein ACFQBQ_10380 [Granulicella cerasi]|uniref:Tetratricopeptide repeat protein n=1 Tax=Granulicella cerasi TaxID=741063 RepID=A0ABW1ZAA5_9BACT|nr:hypothetical protein [Granulicella cerasi]
MLLYAALAGLKTVTDFDLGWQIATGRYLWQHHAIPRVDIFAYTIPGAPWVYPQLSGLIFYGLFRLGGYTAISLLCCAATVATALCLSWRRGILAKVLAILAVPVLASEIMPRASLFTVLLVAVMGRLLIAHFQGRRVQLCWLPLLMLLWANLHPGFVAGLALIVAYGIVELCEFPFASSREAAHIRLRAAAPWLLCSLLAWMANPFGLGMLRVIARQQAAVSWQSVLLEEWQPLRFSQLTTQLGWREPQSALPWLLACAGILILGLLWKRQFGGAMLVLACCGALAQHRRMAGPAIVVICLIAGAALDALETSPWRYRKQVLVGMTASVTLLAAVRIFDVVMNRNSVREGQLTRFGVGASWFLPVKAVDFLLQHPATGHVFAPFSLGSYLIQRGVPVFADGRAVPFGQELLEEQQQLAATPLDAPLWQKAAQRYDITAVLLPLAHIDALGDAPLAADCVSSQWVPVYFDDSAILFERRAHLTAPALNCGTFSTLAEPEYDRIDAYQHTLNAAGIDLALQRRAEAQFLLDTSVRLSNVDDPARLLLQAQSALAADSAPVAEGFLRQALAVQPTDTGWFNLAQLLVTQQRFPEAVTALQRSIPLSQQPWLRYQTLAEVFLATQQPDSAMDALLKAEHVSPYANQQTPAAREFRAAQATDRARAALQRGDIPGALDAMRAAVRETADNSQRRQFLARICNEGHQPCTLQEEQAN